MLIVAAAVLVVVTYLLLVTCLLLVTATMSSEEKDDNLAEEEEDLEQLQAEIARMEEEAARITKETEELEKKKAAATASGTKDEASKDGCSIYVGQVDYATTPEELLAHFEACGTVERITIVCDKYTGRPKGAWCERGTVEDSKTDTNHYRICLCRVPERGCGRERIETG